jgi:predicted nucleic-acid-binding Zn-ribbon protein
MIFNIIYVKDIVFVLLNYTLKISCIFCVLQQKRDKKKVEVFMQQYGLEPCPKCGGKRVAVQTSAGSGIVVSQPQGDSGWMGNKKSTLIQSSACIKCGYLEFYAREPEKLVPDS